MAQITLNSTGVASSGALVLQSNGTTTAVTVSTGQVATFANDAVVNGLTVGRGAGAVSTNTAVGYQAAFTNITGIQYTAIGASAARLATGNQVTAVGASALTALTTGVENVAVGVFSSGAMTTGGYNTAVGDDSLRFTTTGSNNVGIGYAALNSNTTASNNTAVGYQAGYSNTTGSYNTLVGYAAGYSISGSGNTLNTFIGQASGFNVTTGTKNTIIGTYNGNQGGLNISTTSNNIVLSDGDGNPRLYYKGTDSAWKSAEIYNNTSANTANMYIGSGYDIGRVTSALKYKQDVRDIESIDITKFRPVRYKSKCANDDQTKDYFGFIADEVADAGIEELVIRNADNEVESFAYDRMTVVLLKAIQELKAEIDILKGQA